MSELYPGYDADMESVRRYAERNEGRNTERMPGEQGGAEWLAERVGHCTGSKFVAVMAKRQDKKEAAPRYDYRMALVVERLTGKPVETYVSGYMEHGTEQQPAATMAYVAATGALVDEVGFVHHPTVALCGGSVDGTVGADGIIEIKCPATHTHIETLLAGAMPDKHKPQVQGYLWITGRKWCDFISFDPRLPDGLRTFIQRIPRDNDYIAELAGEVMAFLAEVAVMEKSLREIAAKGRP